MGTNAATLSLLLLSQQQALRHFFVHQAGPDASEDLYQSLWLRIQCVRDDPPIDDPPALLFYFARKVALDHGRKEKRRRRLTAAIATLPRSHDDIVAIDEAMISRDQFTRLMVARQMLPEPTRTIFSLNCLRDLPQKTIAQQLGLSRATVERHVARARKLLGQALEPELPVLAAWVSRPGLSDQYSPRTG